MRDKVDGAIREFKKTNTTLFQKEGTEDEFRANLELIS